ncbi:MAG: hypothetical protein JO209_07215, partial [Acidisphaera sp.]|nr:hypothetical protein [Acidisphaera sp.]
MVSAPGPPPDGQAAHRRLAALAEQTKAPALAEREARVIVAEWRRAMPEGGPALMQGVERLMQLLDEAAAAPARAGATALALEAARRALAQEWLALGQAERSPAPAEPARGRAWPVRAWPRAPWPGAPWIV